MADMKNQPKAGIDNPADKIADPVQGARQEAHGVMDRMKEGAQNVMETASDFACQARNKVSEWAGEAYEATADTVGDFGKEVTSFIRRHPLPSILIGFGFGLVLGRATRMI